MTVDAATILSVSFGIWAGVVGVGIRLVLSRLADLDDRLRELEAAVIRLDTQAGK